MGYVAFQSSFISGGNDNYVRFYFKYHIAPTSNDEPIFDSVDAGSKSGTEKLSVRLNSSGSLVAYNAGSSLGTGSTVLAADTWYRIDVHVPTGTAAYSIRINGTTELSGTATFSSNATGNIVLGKSQNRNNNTVDFYYDDVYIDDTAFPEDGGCVNLVPIGAGTYNNWAAVYSDVNEVPANGDTSYCSDTTNGDTESFVHGAINNISVINAAKTVIITRQTNSGATVACGFHSGSTDELSGAYALTNSYAMKQYATTTDPNTGSVWGQSGLNNSEIEFQCVSGSNVGGGNLRVAETSPEFKALSITFIRVTAAYMMVDYLASSSSIYNNTGSGGVKLAGADVIKARYFTSGISGVKIAGVATSKEFYASIPGISGVKIAGVATNTVFPTVFVASGGVKAGGASVCKVRYFIKGQSGIITGGAGATTFFSSNITSNGVLIAGSAVNTLFIKSISTTGGVLVAGSKNSVLLGGKAIVKVVYKCNGISGAKFAGTARNNLFAYQSSISGMKCGGLGIPRLVIKSIIVSGGVKLAGTGISQLATMGVGGAKIGGSIKSNFFSRDRMLSGAKLTGTAISNEFLYSTQPFPFGTRLGGTAIVGRVGFLKDVIRGVGLALGGNNVLKDIEAQRLQKPQVIVSFTQSPVLTPGPRQDTSGTWCDVSENCQTGGLPKVIQNRQNPYLPPKNNEATLVGSNTT